MNTVLKIFGVVVVIVGLATVFSPDAKNVLSDIIQIFKHSQPESKGPQPLTKEEVIQLIKDDMQRFATSINNKDMSVFYNEISDFWKGKTDVNTLNEVFASYINSGIDLTTLTNMTPVVNKEPTVTNNADLQVTGHYNTTPSVLYFKNTYYLQLTGEWKLAEFYVEVKKK